MKKLLVLATALGVLYAFSDTQTVQEGYTPEELRALYSSGDQQKWPKPQLFDEAKEGFQDIGPLGKVSFPTDNPFSEEKVELGKALFFDPRLSKSGQISCANCHNPEIGWGDGQRVSFGHDRLQGTRNAPTIINIGHAKTFFWDGRAATLEDQVTHPIENPVEMNFHSDLAVKRIAKINGYREYFAKAFGDDKITKERINKAIATFERTVVSHTSRFDKFVKGQKEELTDH